MIESRNHYFFYKKSPEGVSIEKEVYVIKRVTLLSRDIEEKELEGIFNIQEKEALEEVARRFPYGREAQLRKKR
ncbi:MAG: hypothetical protein ACD_30C00007G0001 [uncultured bacterium]|uniref:Uncharacterized protein n=3 Tax=Candidatus Daviesiibacteriota TaxID=1752718 RepID=A0A0G0F2Z1_9BACT|nr:MAG: hypothetical protein ACD_30C00007G0001 [uncultured bacterium]KKQ08020.1 MAG: hypothetical protein US19_C0033G0010 [Candidatus Daviesbacteria bacterium GW2011_GWB1_36_5]KKQ13806.1 MAG: hypothetical protein US28_C0044G0009 [Candidatus Daviesbacteria bacterium GW2011_GWA1_36_8]OGE33466.1 MAG: hypothetical protein A3C99_00190 [Candidatus Daviesbacteria bacterium RIFCSPHIGHO2_02_FULL_37_9]OGE35074.1 MAG: hypothetical protein A3E66_04630 [Candidatus Daviesbacteria bacterium RIFCSPHIGHO2_12_FU